MNPKVLLCSASVTPITSQKTHKKNLNYEASGGGLLISLSLFRPGGRPQQKLPFFQRTRRLLQKGGNVGSENMLE